MRKSDPLNYTYHNLTSPITFSTPCNVTFNSLISYTLIVVLFVDKLCMDSTEPLFLLKLRYFNFHVCGMEVSKNKILSDAS